MALHTQICSRYLNEADFRISVKGRSFTKEMTVPSKFCWNQPVIERSARSVRLTDMPENPLSSNFEGTDVSDEHTAKGNNVCDSASQMDLIRQLQASINGLDTNSAKDKQK